MSALCFPPLSSTAAVPRTDAGEILNRNNQFQVFLPEKFQALFMIFAINTSVLPIKQFWGSFSFGDHFVRKMETRQKKLYRENDKFF